MKLWDMRTDDDKTEYCVSRETKDVTKPPSMFPYDKGCRIGGIMGIALVGHMSNETQVALSAMTKVV